MPDLFCSRHNSVSFCSQIPLCFSAHMILFEEPFCGNEIHQTAVSLCDSSDPPPPNPLMLSFCYVNVFSKSKLSDRHFLYLARPQAPTTSSCWVKNHCSLVFWSVTTIYFQLVYHLVQDKCQALKISAFSLHTFLIFVSYIIDNATVTSQNFKSHHRSCVSWVWPGTRNGSWRLELSNPS